MDDGSHVCRQLSSSPHVDGSLGAVARGFVCDECGSSLHPKRCRQCGGLAEEISCLQCPGCGQNDWEERAG